MKRVLREHTSDADLHQLRVNLERIHYEGFVNGDWNVAGDPDGARGVLMGIDLVILVTERQPRTTIQGYTDLAWFKEARASLAQAIEEYEAFEEEVPGMGYAFGPERFEPSFPPQPQLGKSHGKSRELVANSQREGFMVRMAKRITGARVAA